MKRFHCFLFSLLLGTPALPRADSIHDTLYYSRQLKREARYMIILPSGFQEKAKKGRRFPVLYLLHCAGCDHRSFVECYHIEGLIDTFEMIGAIPYDGTGAGWWLDSPVNPLSQLSKWLTGEFKHRIDSLYPTLSDRGTTGVAGHSMGGFGALHNLAKHPEVFSAAFSAKGKIDLIGNAGGYFTDAVLGDFTVSLHNYRAVDILSNADTFVGINAAIKFYTGPNDRFQIENRTFSRRLTKLGVKHEYFENAEDHYCMSRESMRILLAFFDDHFTRKSVAP